MKERKLRLNDYGISEERYMELKYICLQYAHDRRSESIQKRERAAAVEEAAKAADYALAPFIMRNVTERRRYEEMQVPSGINQFFRARRRFFVELDRRVA